MVNPKGTLYMTANSASGSKFYELIPTQQDYIAERSQNWLPSYSVIDMDSDSFSITTYQITAEGKVEAIDDTFTIQKTDGAATLTEGGETYYRLRGAISLSRWRWVSSGSLPFGKNPVRGRRSPFCALGRASCF